MACISGTLNLNDCLPTAITVGGDSPIWGSGEWSIFNAQANTGTYYNSDAELTRYNLEPNSFLTVNSNNEIQSDSLGETPGALIWTGDTISVIAGGVANAGKAIGIKPDGTVGLVTVTSILKITDVLVNTKNIDLSINKLKIEMDRSFSSEEVLAVTGGFTIPFPRYFPFISEDEGETKAASINTYIEFSTNHKYDFTLNRKSMIQITGSATFRSANDNRGIVYFGLKKGSDPTIYTHKVIGISPFGNNAENVPLHANIVLDPGAWTIFPVWYIDHLGSGSVICRYSSYNLMVY